MVNPLYQMYNFGQPMQNPRSNISPVQKVMMAMQAMQNPSAFIKQNFPDIPAEIQNDPNQILGYLQRTRGITAQDIQNVQQMANNPQNLK